MFYIFFFYFFFHLPLLLCICINSSIIHKLFILLFFWSHFLAVFFINMYNNFILCVRYDIRVYNIIFYSVLYLNNNMRVLVYLLFFLLFAISNHIENKNLNSFSAFIHFTFIYNIYIHIFLFCSYNMCIYSFIHSFIDIVHLFTTYIHYILFCVYIQYM